MIISRTPFRISFFGGGTDYPAWYRENKGRVLGVAINKYCYIFCRHLPPFFAEYKSRIIYSKIELVKDHGDILHPAVRECLKFMDMNEGLEIHHDGDLPARTGLGSSSSFTVGLLHALYALKGVMPTKRQLALDAIHLEQNCMKENVGSQDQTLAAFGGINLIEFSKNGELNVLPVTISSDRIYELQGHLLLYFTGISRIASEIAKEQVENISNRRRELTIMYEMVGEALDILNSRRDIGEFGLLLNENWKLKKTLSSRVSTAYVDEIYTAAIRAGALGGKLLGAGGGGFMLLFARPQDQPAIHEALKDLLYVPFRFEVMGSQIIFHTPWENMLVPQ